MATIPVTYYLKNPDSRPNPFRIGPSVVFVDGAFTNVIDEAKLPSVDKFMANYGAFRTPPEGSEDGSDQVQTDGNLSDGEGQVSGEASESGGSTESSSSEGEGDAETEEGDTGSVPSEGSAEGSETSGLDPVKRRTAAEVEAGLDTVQAAEFRASDEEDPMVWFETNYPEEYALAHGEDENLA